MLRLLSLVVLAVRLEAAPPESQVAPSPRLKPIQILEAPPPRIEPFPAINVQPPLDIRVNGPFSGRAGIARDKLVQLFGGNEESERGVARGVAWLARQQRADGSWEFDGKNRADTIAATAMCLLPFLGAGQSHKTSPKYSKTVEMGLKYLIGKQKADGSFETAGFTMDSQALATLALCEAHGMTRDRNLLQRPAQAAINYLVARQNADGGWGDERSEMALLGWSSQALYAAVLAKSIVVPGRAIEKLVAYLDGNAIGPRKAAYGDTKANGKPGTTLTAIGLLSRYNFDNWGSGNAGLVEGVEGFAKGQPLRVPSKPEMQFYHYATQLIRYADGPKWKDWNEGLSENGKRSGGMRDWLVSLQEKKEGPNYGSWGPDGEVGGNSYGRLGTTALSILTLEVYYRYVPRNHPDIKMAVP